MKRIVPILHRKPLSFNSNGSYGTVFFHSGDKAVKLFKKTNLSRDHIQLVYKSEVGAYEIAQGIATIVPIIPIFYGEVIVGRVLDESGIDISAQFHLDVAYEMEKIEGRSHKAGHSDNASLVEIKQILHSHGINHTTDMDVWIEKDVIQKIVDFAIQEYEPLWTPY
jgi:hypothetical protein